MERRAPSLPVYSTSAIKLFIRPPLWAVAPLQPSEKHPLHQCTYIGAQKGVHTAIVASAWTAQ